MKEQKDTTTLVESEVSSEGVSRRAALGRVAAIAATAGVLAVGLAPGEAAAQCTDSDGGRFADGVGRGRRCRRRRCTDSDGGRFADGVGRGRRC